MQQICRWTFERFFHLGSLRGSCVRLLAVSVIILWLADRWLSPKGPGSLLEALGKISPAASRHISCEKPFRRGCHGESGRLLTVDDQDLAVRYPPPRPLEVLNDALDEHKAVHTQLCTGQRPARLMVFTCGVANLACPSISDGIHGIILTYMLAFMSQRAFIVYTPGWISFEKYFQLKMNVRLESCATLDTDQIKAAITANAVDFTSPKNDGRGYKGLLHSSTAVLAILPGQDVMQSLYPLLRQSGIPVNELEHQSVGRIAFERLFDFPGMDMKMQLRQFLSKEKIDLEQTVCINMYSEPVSGERLCEWWNMDDYWRCARSMEKSTHQLSALSRTTWLILSEDPKYLQLLESFLERCSPHEQLFRQVVDRKLVSTAEFSKTLVGEAAERNQGSERGKAPMLTFFHMYLLSQCPHVVSAMTTFSRNAARLGLDWSQRRFLEVERRERFWKASYTRVACKQTLFY